MPASLVPEIPASALADASVAAARREPLLVRLFRRLDENLAEF